MKMTVETVCSRKVTLREDVLSSYEKRYGMGVLGRAPAYKKLDVPHSRKIPHVKDYGKTASSGGKAA